MRLKYYPFMPNKELLVSNPLIPKSENAKLHSSKKGNTQKFIWSTQYSGWLPRKCTKTKFAFLEERSLSLKPLGSAMEPQQTNRDHPHVFFSSIQAYN